MNDFYAGLFLILAFGYLLLAFGFICVIFINKD